jgi:predicted RNA-binding Zn-ribbon protein involved in translation (DUF1610 family)
MLGTLEQQSRKAQRSTQMSEMNPTTCPECGEQHSWYNISNDGKIAQVKYECGAYAKWHINGGTITRDADAWISCSVERSELQRESSVELFFCPRCGEPALDFARMGDGTKVTFQYGCGSVATWAEYRDEFRYDPTTFVACTELPTGNASSGGPASEDGSRSEKHSVMDGTGHDVFGDMVEGGHGVRVHKLEKNPPLLRKYGGRWDPKAREWTWDLERVSHKMVVVDPGVRSMSMADSPLFDDGWTAEPALARLTEQEADPTPGPWGDDEVWCPEMGEWVELGYSVNISEDEGFGDRWDCEFDQHKGQQALLRSFDAKFNREVEVSERRDAARVRVERMRRIYDWFLTAPEKAEGLKAQGPFYLKLGQSRKACSRNGKWTWQYLTKAQANTVKACFTAMRECRTVPPYQGPELPEPEAQQLPVDFISYCLEGDNEMELAPELESCDEERYQDALKGVEIVEGCRDRCWPVTLDVKSTGRTHEMIPRPQVIMEYLARCGAEEKLRAEARAKDAQRSWEDMVMYAKYRVGDKGPSISDSEDHMAHYGWRKLPREER